MDWPDMSEAASMSEWGRGHEFAITILLNGAITESERSIARESLRTLAHLIKSERNKHNPTLIAQGAEEKRRLVQCFAESGISPIYVEEIPNGYCSQSCCVTKPWLIVTTAFGRIKIGWRKSVICLDWEDSEIDKTAIGLFPSEDVTKFDRIIHAWGYDKAVEYLSHLAKVFYAK